MAQSSVENAPLLRARAEVFVSATPDEVYATVSDLPRSGQWSPECTGGTWISGDPATVGAVFRGENHRSEDVVAWAPVVRGRWSTESEVIAAEPGRVFRWAMRNSSGERQDSVWSFEMEPADGGCLLAHHFRMGDPTEGIKGITADMDQAERQQFFADWGAKLEKDLAATLDRVRAVIEQK